MNRYLNTISKVTFYSLTEKIHAIPYQKNKGLFKNEVLNFLLKIFD
jgi:hypothetical protein